MLIAIIIRLIVILGRIRKYDLKFYFIIYIFECNVIVAFFIISKVLRLFYFHDFMDKLEVSLIFCNH